MNTESFLVLIMLGLVFTAVSTMLLGICADKKKLKLPQSQNNWEAEVFQAIRATFKEKGLEFEISQGEDCFSGESAILGQSQELSSGVSLLVTRYYFGLKTEFPIKQGLSSLEKEILDKIVEFCDPDRRKVEGRDENGNPYAWSMRISYTKDHLEKVGGNKVFAELLYSQLVRINELYAQSDSLRSELKQTHDSYSQKYEEILSRLDKMLGV